MLFSLSSFYLFSTHNSLVFVFHFLLVRSNLLISLIICWRDDKSLRLLYNVRIKLSLGPKVPYETDLRLALGQKYHLSLPIIGSKLTFSGCCDRQLPYSAMFIVTSTTIET